MRQAPRNCGAGSSTCYGLPATGGGPATDGLAAGLAENLGELSHAAFDPLVNLVEHRAALTHRVAHSPHLDRFRIEVPQDHHVDRPAPEALAHDTTLNRVHYHYEIGRTQQLDGDET